MDKYRILSYPLSNDTPVYAGDPPLSIEPAKSMPKGNSCNTFKITFCNHSGTHVDAPAHFDMKGRPISDYGMEELIFNRSCIVDCLKGPDEFITPEDLKNTGTKCDLLLVRTGFDRYRSKEEYVMRNPGVSTEAAEWIRRERPNIRAVGIDTISVSPHADREGGRKTHRIFLQKGIFKSDPVILIEGLRLGGAAKLKTVYVVPLFIDGADSSPCTVLAI